MKTHCHVGPKLAVMSLQLPLYLWIACLRRSLIQISFLLNTLTFTLIIIPIKMHAAQPEHQKDRRLQKGDVRLFRYLMKSLVYTQLFLFHIILQERHCYCYLKGGKSYFLLEMCFVRNTIYLLTTTWQHCC